MSESIISATISNIQSNQGAMLLAVSEELCPHCGTHVHVDPRDWQFTRSRKRPYRCWSCGDDMHDLTPLVNLSDLTETEKAVYELIEADGPITGEDIANELGLSERQVSNILSPSKGKLRTLGVENQKSDGYSIRK